MEFNHEFVSFRSDYTHSTSGSFSKRGAIRSSKPRLVEHTGINAPECTSLISLHLTPSTSMSSQNSYEFAQTKPVLESGDESSDDELSNHHPDSPSEASYKNQERSRSPASDDNAANNDLEVKKIETLVRSKAFIELNVEELHELNRLIKPILSAGPAKWECFFQYCWARRMDMEKECATASSLFDKTKLYIQALLDDDDYYNKFWFSETDHAYWDHLRPTLEIGATVRTYVTGFRSFGIARFYAEDGSRLHETDDGILAESFNLRHWALIHDVEALISLLKKTPFSASQQEEIAKGVILFVSTCRSIL